MCAVSSSLYLINQLDDLITVLNKVNENHDNPITKFFPLFETEQYTYEEITTNEKGEAFVLDKIRTVYHVKVRIDEGRFSSFDKLETLSNVIMLKSKIQKSISKTNRKILNEFVNTFVNVTYNDLISKKNFIDDQKRPKRTKKEVRYKDYSEILFYDVDATAYLDKNKSIFIPLNKNIRGGGKKLPSIYTKYLLTSADLNENTLTQVFKTVARIILDHLRKNIKSSVRRSVLFGIPVIFHKALEKTSSFLEQFRHMQISEALNMFKMLFRHSIDDYFLESEEQDEGDKRRFASLNFSTEERRIFSVFLSTSYRGTIFPRFASSEQKMILALRTILINFFTQIKYPGTSLA